MSGCLGGGTPSGGVIPDLAGATTADAIAVLQDTGFTHIRIQQKPSATVRPQAVITTDPPAHARVLYSQTVTVVVSSGPIQVR
ncbi:PASTA domain-containing protein (plasmid) [Mycolicibacterium psychrotolerans]|uniref:PASTA domain-containing protein n=1 Tax=Mycolicibacterium psychrotolerans TaxID=216929 RepID=UPI003D6699B7